MAILRNEDGFNSFRSDHPLANLDFTNPLKWATWMEDFLAYDIGQAAGNPFTLTQTNGVDTIVGPTGVLVLTLGGADNDAAQLQLTEAPFQTNSKQLFFQARFKLVLASGGTVAANELFVGLASEQVTTAFFAADGLSLAMDDALGFYKLDAEASMSAIMRENDSGSTDAGVLTPVTATWVTVAIWYDGTEAKFYVGNAADGSDMALAATITGNDVTSVLTPTLYIKAGEAKANVLHCDYLFVAAER